MPQRIVIRVDMSAKYWRHKIFEIAGKVPGVESIKIIGQEKNHVEVLGDGFDSTELMILLRKKLGSPELVSLDRGYGPIHGSEVSNQNPYGYPGHRYEVGYYEKPYAYGGGYGYETRSQNPHGYGLGHGYEVSNYQNPYPYGVFYGYETMNQCPNAYGPVHGYETKNPYADGPGHWDESRNENSDGCSIM